MSSGSVKHSTYMIVSYASIGPLDFFSLGTRYNDELHVVYQTIAKILINALIGENIY